MCRKDMAARWIRIHSLPDSKRYPDTDAERNEILRRHNTVATEVLGESAACILFTTQFGESRQWEFYEKEAGRYKDGFNLITPLNPAYVMTVSDDDDGPIQIFAARCYWHTGTFNNLILACADDLTGHILFANTEKGSAYAPYDGGADLFFGSPNSAPLARAMFSSWLSGTESGL